MIATLLAKKEPYMKSANTLSNPKTQLSVRNATVADIPQIADLSSRAYEGTGMHGYS